jgi:hypothetical protein
MQNSGSSRNMITNVVIAIVFISLFVVVLMAQIGASADAHSKLVSLFIH